MSITKVELLSQEGQRRAQIERKLLSVLFNGFSNIELIDFDTQTISMLYELCDLAEYNRLARGEEEEGFTSLTDNAKVCFCVLKALDALVDRDLVERKLLFTPSDNPEDGPIDMTSKMDITPIYWRSNRANYLALSRHKVRGFDYPEEFIGPNAQPFYCSFDYIQYRLTTKGYDVALKFQEHEDQEKRYEQTKELSSEATNANVSSSRTANLAVGVAIFIALGSVGNLVLSAYSKFWQ